MQGPNWCVQFSLDDDELFIVRDMAAVAAAVEWKIPSVVGVGFFHRVLACSSHLLSPVGRSREQGASFGSG